MIWWYLSVDIFLLISFGLLILFDLLISIELLISVDLLISFDMFIYFDPLVDFWYIQSVHAIVELCFKRRVMFLRHGLCSKKTDYVRATWLMCSMFTDRRLFGALATCLCFKWRVMHRKTELCFYDDQNGALARSLEHSPFFGT